MVLRLPSALKPVNASLSSVTLADIENHKLVSRLALCQDLHQLLAAPAVTNANTFAGNRILYHFQFKNLLRCRRNKGQTLYETYADPVAWAKLLADTAVRNRGGRTAAGNVFECFRINKGSVVMFKSTTAKYLYKKYGATAILDPTAGWGGRLLGAWALGLSYTGCETNVAIRPAYTALLDFLEEETSSAQSLFTDARPTHRMIWENCLTVDFSTLHYDFVLTSPPYVNLEQYEHMPTWTSPQAFYVGFLIPLWHKCVASIARGGHVCLNLSPAMYTAALAYGLPPCHEEEALLQQMGHKQTSLAHGKKPQDQVYVWHC